MSDEAQRQVHEAVGGMLGEGEIAVAWCLVIDVAGPDNTRYLAHRAGGGIDGTVAPVVWAALGMLRAGTAVAEDQLLEVTEDVDDEDDEDDE